MMTSNSKKLESGKLIITDEGKLILTGEIFDKHGSYNFDAFVDTGSSFGLIVPRGLADAVCSKAEGDVRMSIGGGSNTTHGQKRRADFRFGNLVLKNYEMVVIDGSRCLVGIKFFQDTNALMVADFFKGETKGGMITNDRGLVKIIGKAVHCFSTHKSDITRSTEPCSICGASGE